MQLFNFIVNLLAAVHCPVVPERRGLTVNTQSTKLNTQLKFTCINGNSLIGAQDITCLPSGNWSAPFPVCESEYCQYNNIMLNRSKEKQSHKCNYIVSYQSLAEAREERYYFFLIFCVRNTFKITLCHVGIECGEVGGVMPPRLRATIISREVGGRAQFSCDHGFGIRGPHETICLISGEWATPYPTCVGTFQ